MRYVDCTSRNSLNYSRDDIDNNILSLLRSELVDIFLHRNLAVREATADEQLVKRFNMLLAVHSFEHRDVEHYAAEFNLPPKRFAAKVKRVTGTTPSDLIASAVVRNAKKLLVSTELSSAEIAEKLNFSTPSFFCRYFKRYAGTTPQEWRVRSTSY
jgi:AraC family transcriptional activator of pobA